MHSKYRRNSKEMKKEIPVFPETSLSLNNSKLHREIIKRLNAIKKPQAYLTKRLQISRSTLWRIDQGKTIELQTFLKLVSWLGEDVNNYLTNQ